MRLESERLWIEDEKVGDLFKFDYDRLLSLIPTDIQFRRSDLSPKKSKNGRLSDIEPKEEQKLD